MTRILIVDDQVLFAESLRTVLEASGEPWKVCGLAENGREAVDAVEELKPDLVLMDVRMPVMDGVAATRILKSKHPALRILMLTTFEDDEYVREALRYGVSGYLLKSIPASELLASLRAALSGALQLDPRVVQALVGQASEGKGSESPSADAPPPWFDELTRKERQVLGLMVGGFHNDEIAERVCMAPQTVRNYISRIYDKLGTADRVAAVRMARSTGLF
ncbi:MAG: response regulator transcription factor [Spirochaetales bacterium]